MDGTGSTTSKAEERKSPNELPKAMWKYLPSMVEQNLLDKANAKKR
jgi:hypothetical protein